MIYIQACPGKTPTLAEDIGSSRTRYLPIACLGPTMIIHRSISRERTGVDPGSTGDGGSPRPHYITMASLELSCIILSRTDLSALICLSAQSRPTVSDRPVSTPLPGCKITVRQRCLSPHLPVCRNQVREKCLPFPACHQHFTAEVDRL
jgi:hypothetical protein